MSKHDLVEYALAKDAVKKLPELERILDKTYLEVYKYREYLSANYVLDAIAESKSLIKRQYKAAKEVVIKKGKV